MCVGYTCLEYKCTIDENEKNFKRRFCSNSSFNHSRSNLGRKQRPSGFCGTEKHSQLALSMLNVSEISKKALGKYWAKRSNSEREKFQVLLGEMFVHVAFPSSAKFFAELALVYGKTNKKNQKVVVPLTVVHKKEGEVGIDFHMIQAAGKWQVVDVVLDGASMRNNLRSKFYKTIKKKGFDKLILIMEKKLKTKKN